MTRREPTLADTAEPLTGDRRLFRRYPSGLAAELVLPDGATPCRIGDISLGGACVDLGAGEPPPAAGARLRLRSQHMASGHDFPAEVRQVAGSSNSSSTCRAPQRGRG